MRTIKLRFIVVLPENFFILVALPEVRRPCARLIHETANLLIVGIVFLSIWDFRLLIWTLFVLSLKISGSVINIGSSIHDSPSTMQIME